MADELDVDIEGDEYDAKLGGFGDGAALLQDQYLQSAWKTNTGVLPWELDSSISAENREVIENMLLEEQYYLTGKELPKSVWANSPNCKPKPKVKKSPAKPSGSGSSTATRWSQQEKELFETGLAQFGRRWTKISKLVGSRTVLQVKSYARQYFKHKAKSEGNAIAVATPTAPVVLGQVTETGSTVSTSGLSVPTHLSALTNAVRIERLGDEEEEEVDITDDFSDEGGSGEGNGGERRIEGIGEDLQAGVRTETREPGAPEELDNHGETHQVQPNQTHPRLGETDQEQPNCSPPSPLTAPCPAEQAPSGQCEGGTAEPLRESGEETGGSGWQEAGEEQGEESEEEEEELTAPEQEVELDLATITEEEKQAIPEFFEGRPSKTPERYLRIRNYMLDQWLKSKPRYLNKTSVRPGLKNCGDVNCIGRIHTYLELIGGINFNCDQAVYNRPRVVDRSKPRESRDTLEYQLAQRLQSMRTRKRRVRDVWGNWRDAKDLEGQTYEHLSAEELALRREMRRPHKPCKVSRHRGLLDPFQLIPCREFGKERQEPFQVIVCAEALLIMDMHAHVSMGEVIGLLGGAYSEVDKVLKIVAAEPCNSVSTGLQCEMDPLSQTQACELLSSLGLAVVGWYHSHPTFHPNPSLRDIHTQDQFQSYFSRGGAPFIGMIVSPFDPANPSPRSQTTCLMVREDQGPGPQKLPYRFDYQCSQQQPDWSQLMRRAEWIIHKYKHAHGSVQMDRLFRRDSHLTCLEKMMSSLGRYLEPLLEEEGDPFLSQIHTLFLSHFVTEKPRDQDEGETSDSSEPINTHAFPFAQPINVRGTDDTGTQENWENESISPIDNIETPSIENTNSHTANQENLHPIQFGSVLLTGHDYLF
ncbi:histone H2A deubiquitinase MYSM1-like isoform X1 [Coregonus clupeaformis]|uniref:histone H2A deubiquitinase MYSM1-like isoform X1 n=1 Tax=Coregonus clupeaformis TaxID=59861 RepID=UPI001BE0F72C|nr:histone H2A deubiquitinase MYSM1-like isoform X1 [Coregonus clupeaformis]